MHKPDTDWLDVELQRSMRGASAPAELWDRIQSGRMGRPTKTNRALIWAMAATVALGAVGLSDLQRRSVVADSEPVLLRCENAPQIRPWVLAKSDGNGLAAQRLQPSLQLAGAQIIIDSRQSDCKLCHLD